MQEPQPDGQPLDFEEQGLDHEIWHLSLPLFKILRFQNTMKFGPLAQNFQGEDQLAKSTLIPRKQVKSEDFTVKFSTTKFSQRAILSNLKQLCIKVGVLDPEESNVYKI